MRRKLNTSFPYDEQCAYCLSYSLLFSFKCPQMLFIFVRIFNDKKLFLTTCSEYSNTMYWINIHSQISNERNLNRLWTAEALLLVWVVAIIVRIDCTFQNERICTHTHTQCIRNDTHLPRYVLQRSGHAVNSCSLTLRVNRTVSFIICCKFKSEWIKIKIDRICYDKKWSTKIKSNQSV